MNRTYEINKTETGWQLVVLEDGKEIARVVAGDTDEGYAYLLDQAQTIYGITKEPVRRSTWWCSWDNPNTN